MIIRRIGLTEFIFFGKMTDGILSKIHSIHAMMSVSSSTFRSVKGGRWLEDCSACPAGYFCPHSATVNPTVCGTGSYSVSPF